MTNNVSFNKLPYLPCWLRSSTKARHRLAATLYSCRETGLSVKPTQWAFLLILLFFNSHAKADENVCPLYIVNFWSDFSERNGINSVPAFLIENGCIEGPNEIVIAYDEYQFLLENKLVEYSYLGDSYEAKYYVQNYARESINENIEGNRPLKINDEISHPKTAKKIPMNFQPQQNSNELTANIPAPVTDSNVQTLYQPVYINLYLFTVRKNEFSYLLSAILISIILLGFILYSRNRHQETIQRQYKEKVCPDCSSKVKPGNNQCLVCGSYV